ncbi:MAG: tetratricopeptide repeat protein [Bryobacterales bacterium]|nr:tetratricopeptide repeat protein [Bryobacterales bacterium]
MLSKRIDMIREMLAQNPTDSFLLYGLANEHKNEGDLPQAIASYRHLLDVNPDYVAAYYHLGQTLESAGESEAAASTYDSGIAVARRIGDAHAMSELQAARDILG